MECVSGELMKDTFYKPRSKLRTVFVVVAPSGILLIGTWLVCMAAFMLSEVPFEPNWIIILVGMLVVLTMALFTIVFIARGKETVKGPGQPSPEP